MILSAETDAGGKSENHDAFTHTAFSVWPDLLPQTLKDLAAAVDSGIRTAVGKMLEKPVIGRPDEIQETTTLSLAAVQKSADGSLTVCTQTVGNSPVWIVAKTNNGQFRIRQLTQDDNLPFAGQTHNISEAVHAGGIDKVTKGELAPQIFSEANLYKKLGLDASQCEGIAVVSASNSILDGMPYNVTKEDIQDAIPFISDDIYDQITKNWPNLELITDFPKVASSEGIHNQISDLFQATRQMQLNALADHLKEIKADIKNLAPDLVNFAKKDLLKNGQIFKKSSESDITVVSIYTRDLKDNEGALAIVCDGSGDSPFISKLVTTLYDHNFSRFLTKDYPLPNEVAITSQIKIVREAYEEGYVYVMKPFHQSFSTIAAEHGYSVTMSELTNLKTGEKNPQIFIPLHEFKKQYEKNIAHEKINLSGGLSFQKGTYQEGEFYVITGNPNFQDSLQNSFNILKIGYGSEPQITQLTNPISGEKYQGYAIPAENFYANFARNTTQHVYAQMMQQNQVSNY